MMKKHYVETMTTLKSTKVTYSQLNLSTIFKNNEMLKSAREGKNNVV
jgi:hypothetical protein